MIVWPRQVSRSIHKTREQRNNYKAKYSFWSLEVLKPMLRSFHCNRIAGLQRELTARQSVQPDRWSTGFLTSTNNLISATHLLGLIPTCRSCHQCTSSAQRVLKLVWRCRLLHPSHVVGATARARVPPLQLLGNWIVHLLQLGYARVRSQGKLLQTHARRKRKQERVYVHKFQWNNQWDIW